MAKREQIMLAYAWDPNRFQRWKKPVIVQPKIEGDRCRAVIDGRGRAALFSSGVKTITSVPHINSQLRSLNLNPMELDGELYVHGMVHQDIRSIVSPTVYRNPYYEKMQYWIFDLVSDTYQLERLRYLGKMNFAWCPSVVRVPFYLVNTLEEVERVYQEQLELGFEGIILREANTPYLRKKTTTMMKLKPTVSDYYVIVGFEEEISIKGEPKNALGALWVKGVDSPEFKVGSGFTRDLREKLWKDRAKLIGKIVKVRYQGLTSDLKPYFGRFVGFVDL